MGDPSVASLLESYGIEEIEPNICEDTYANRETLRANKRNWEAVRGEDGEITGMIRVRTDAMIEANQRSTWERRKPVMQNPENPYSEFVGPDEYPVDVDIPWWVKHRLNIWTQSQLRGEPDKDPFPVRCSALRTDGNRCWNWAPKPDQIDRCRMHIKRNAVRADYEAVVIAKLRLMQAGPALADTLIDLAQNAEVEAVRLRAATEGLDRIGVRGGTELDVQHHDSAEQVDPTQEIRERLNKIADQLRAKELETSSDIVEGEIVDESTTQA